MRNPPYRWGGTATGFYPPLLALVMAQWMVFLFAVGPPFMLVWPTTLLFANIITNLAMLGIAAVAYLAWVWAVARGWITAATGGGLTIAAYAVCLRLIVEFPHCAAGVPLAEQAPPEPYDTILVFARTLGLAAYVTGLAFVLAAVVTERRLRRTAPSWAITR